MPSTPLGSRLRQLRLDGWTGSPIKQARVAEALGMTAPSVSSYENGTVPPVERLRDYALFFATPRWMERDAPRRPVFDFLTPDERARFEELHAELQELRDRSDLSIQPGSGRTSETPFWQFPDNLPVRVYCGRLDDEHAGRYSSPDDHNYMHLRNAADLDSLVELWGHIRRLNPDNDVRYIVGEHLTSGDLQSHVVILGNLAHTQGDGKILPPGALPVRQVHVAGLEGEVFEVDTDDGPHRFEPRFGGDGRLVEDVGLLARVANPYSPRSSFTFCSGVFTRGVFGAVRCLTDKGLRDDNSQYLRSAFPDLSSFALLMRVSIADDTTTTPNLHNEWNRLFEIPKL